MNEDNNMGSMARQALTGVNDGASAPTQDPKVNEAKASGGFADLLGGSGVQQTQNATAPTSGPLGFLVGGAPNTGETALPRTPEALMASLSAEAMRTAKNVISRRIAPGSRDIMQGYPQASSPLSRGTSSDLLAEAITLDAIRKQQNESLGGVRRDYGVRPPNSRLNENNIGRGPEVDLRPVLDRVEWGRPFNGGSPVPHYDYNGVSVALPDGVDTNDSAAVGKAMVEQNEMIDIFNSMNDEEV